MVEQEDQLPCIFDRAFRKRQGAVMDQVLASGSAEAVEKVAKKVFELEAF
eukprot:IDg8994t1